MTRRSGAEETRLPPPAPGRGEGEFSEQIKNNNGGLNRINKPTERDYRHPAEELKLDRIGNNAHEVS